jgi:hypothetical protein
MSLNFDNLLWLALICSEALLVGTLFYRRIWRVLPVFSMYFLWDLLTNAAAFVIYHYYFKAYESFYIFESIIDSFLELAILVELAWAVLRPMRSSLSRSALIVVCALIVTAGAIIWPFVGIPGLAHASKLVLMFAQFQQTISVLRILFFLFLAAASQLLSMSWRDRELQAATGLGFYSMVSVTVAMIEAHQTSFVQVQRLNHFVIIANICALFYWLVSFAQKEAERREFTPQMQSFLLSVAGAAHSTRVSLSSSRGGKTSGQDKH